MVVYCPCCESVSVCNEISTCGEWVACSACSQVIPLNPKTHVKLQVILGGKSALAPSEPVGKLRLIKGRAA